MITSHFGCVKNTIRTYTGRYFDLACPRPDEVDIQDIANALSKICRFGSQISEFYSVAEHSVHCSRVAESDGLPAAAQLAILLHDAAEAYVGDMVKPLKIMMPAFSRVEASVEKAIGVAFGVDFGAWRAQTKEIDHGMLMAERRQLFSRDGVEWTGESTARFLDVPIHRMPHAEAKESFLNAFYSIKNDA